MPRNRKEQSLSSFELDADEFLQLMAQPLKDAGLINFDPTGVQVQEEMTGQGPVYIVTVERKTSS